MLSSRYVYVILSLILFAAPLKAEELLKDKAQEDRAVAIFSILKCAVCKGQSIKDSNSEIAFAMRQNIRYQILQGKNDDEIIANIEKSYGKEINLNPKFESSNYFLWLAPLAFFIIGLIVIFKRIRFG